MRPLLAFSFLLALTTAARAASPPSSLPQVPAGVEVRLTLQGQRRAVRGSFVDAGPESLRIRPRRGDVVAMPSSSVSAFSFVSDVQASPRKATLLGIGIGATGGAVFGALVGSGLGSEGGGGGGEGEGGGGAPRLAMSRMAAAASAASTVQGKASADYRAVVGALIGGIAGGVVGSLTGLGMTEERWQSVPMPGQHASWNAGPAAPPVFAVRFALPTGSRQR